ncbi:lysine--tRNA ligase [Bacillus sp. FJAT-49736]|uniref:lysine--tRNA ligase n=1 Tax=Bacillus sp. FJAT-49736 TaxID=2833582 RepID=UPI001BCA3F84|nr:lysine--tRNA ligase [Bacillus sp. FJAT-49736]MBS4172685.1 lysine--tRNA ligase [Bacillus sp. FJAT-49736]
MHWAFQIATRLIEKYPTKKVFTCASGISPSGSVHVGNFREIVTTYFVVKALESLGKKTRFIFSWDDYDRLRKIPQNVTTLDNSHIGMPYSDVPNPYGPGSYAQYFELEFERSLHAFGIKPQFIYQSAEYRSGRYTSYIQTALKRRKEIYDILMDFKSGVPSEVERENFYPISLYCLHCNKDNITITSFDEPTGKLEYKCICGYSDRKPLEELRNIKLNWKVDWAMRWMVEDVIFEPGGRDHSAATGSYNVSKVIAKEIFEYEAPEYTPYEFIGLKGITQKMSSSSGNVITPNDLLQVYTPEIILFLFARYRPNTAFEIGFDEDVLRNYAEYERYLASYKNGFLEDEDIKSSLEIAGASQAVEYPSFSKIAGIFPLIDFNKEVLQQIFMQAGEEYPIEKIISISTRVSHWIKTWNPHRVIQINQEKNILYYSRLTDEQKDRIKQLVFILSSYPNLDGESLMKEVYAICHTQDKKRMRECQKQLFKDIYQLVLNESSGPRIPLLISAVGKQKVIGLLSF